MSTVSDHHLLFTSLSEQPERKKEEEFCNMKSLIIITVLKATLSAVAVAVFLLPSPAHMAPSVHKRQVGPSASNTSVEAYNGLTVTLIYVRNVY